MSDRFHPLKRRQLGTTLIEALIAFVILGLGLLGMLALQIKAQNADFESFQRSQALLMVEDMVNRIAARGTYAGGYLTGDMASLPGEWPEGTNPASGQTAQDDMAAWNSMLQGSGELAGTDDVSVGGLLGAVGCIEQDASNPDLIYVSVAWQGMAEMDLPAGVNACGAGKYESENLRRVLTLPLHVN